MAKKTWIVWLLSLVSPFVGRSQPAVEMLDLPTALETAKQNYPSIKAKVAEKESAAFTLSAMRDNYLPSFLVQGQVTNATSNQVRGTFFPNEGTAIPTSGGIKTNGYTSDAVWTSFVTGLVNWKVYGFGKYRAAVETARAGVSAADAEYQNEVFQHQVKVGDAYLLALILRDMVKSQTANLARVNALREVTTAYARSGLKPGVDSSLVNAEYSQAVLSLLAARRLADEQTIQLQELMGRIGGRDLALDTLLLLKGTPALIEPEKPPGDNPRLLFYKSLVDFNASKISTLRRSELPSISFLAAGWGRGSGISNSLQSNGDFSYHKSFSAGVPLQAYDYMLGVSTIWNVTSLFKTGHEAKAQRFVTRMAEERYNEEALKIGSELATARLRYAAAIEIARQAPLQLGAARDAYRQAKARYDAGLNSILELTQTFALLNRAETDAAVARGNVWRAVLQYAAASGDFQVFLNMLTGRL